MGSVNTRRSLGKDEYFIGASTLLPPADVIDCGVSAEDLPNCRKCGCFSRRRLCRGSQQKRLFFNGFRALWLALRSNASVPSRPSLSAAGPPSYGMTRGRLCRIHEVPECLRLKNDRPAVLQVQNAPTLPVSKTAIDLLACSAGHFRQFTLGERKFRRRRTLRLI